MTDKEMAEEYYYKKYPVTLNIGEEERKKEVMDIFLAGLKAGRPQWHDLEKNPDDLPKKGKLVICYLAEDVFDVGIFKTEIELQCGKARILKWAYFDLPKDLK